MKKVRMIFIVAMFFPLFGCVTTKEHNARLLDIDNLKKDVSSLDGKLKEKEAQKAAVEADLAKLTKELEELKKQNKALSDDNVNLDGVLKAKKDELSGKVSELRGKLAEKELELNAKNAEIDSLKKQIIVLSQEKNALMLEINALNLEKDALNQEKERAIKEKEKSVAEMKKTYDSLIGEMNEEIKKGEISVTQLKDKLSVNLVEKILFDSGSADIKKDGKKVIDRVAEILKKVADKQIRVEGFTDNVPISSRLEKKFASNWELSTARATTVARYLQDKGIDPKVLGACGYSEYRPIASNDTEEGRANNRRIEIALIPKDADIIKTEEGIKKE